MEPSCNGQIEVGALPCDAYHHFYHYQSSAQYLWLAETLLALGNTEDAQTAYARAVFQDHRNEEALARKKGVACGRRIPRYDKHPLFDHEFRALIEEAPDEAGKLHDEAIALMQECFVIPSDPDSRVGSFAALRMTEIKTLLDRAINTGPQHSNSFFARGKYHFLQEEFSNARADFLEAIRLSHLHHDAYHRSASNEHVARGKKLAAKGELDLAVSDFTKALDLFRGNKEALALRAETYRAKGSGRLAEEDERTLASLSRVA